MKKILLIFILFYLYGCQKSSVVAPLIIEEPAIVDTISAYTKYTIFKGRQYCDKSTIKAFSGTGIKFNVKFDSSAIYKTVNPDNQDDINKLYGFSEGIDNHFNSARFGWGWSKNALHLYAYVYAEGERKYKEISTVAIGAAIACSITIKGGQYLFSADGKNVELGRGLKDESVKGYWQYPYFGGDEVALNNIYIYIQDTK